jgi:hypothetical protein
MSDERRITIRFGPHIQLGYVYQLMCHELSHDVIRYMDIDDGDHGPKFRAVLRKFVRVRWPNVEKWIERDEPGADVCYAEDDDMAAAITRLYKNAQTM